MEKEPVNKYKSSLSDGAVKDPDEYLAYLKREMEIMDYDNALYEAGLDGEARGEARGIKKGYAQGDFNLVMTLINKGYTLADALSLLDITEDRWKEVNQILNKNEN